MRIRSLHETSEQDLDKVLALADPSSFKVFIRPRKLEYFYDKEHPVGAGVINTIDRDVTKTVSWTDKKSTTLGMSVSATAQASFPGYFSVSITAAFNASWVTEQSFSDTFTMTVPPPSCSRHPLRLGTALPCSLGDVNQVSPKGETEALRRSMR